MILPTCSLHSDIWLIDRSQLHVLDFHTLDPLIIWGAK